MRIAIYDKKRIANIKFTYLDNENIALYESNNILIKEDELCCEILDQTKILEVKFFNKITRVQISFEQMENIEILIEIPFSYLLDKKNIIYSSYYFNKYLNSINSPYFSTYNRILDNLKKLETIKYDIGYIEEESEEAISILFKGELPINIASFFKKLELNKKYYEHYLFF